MKTSLTVLLFWFLTMGCATAQTPSDTLPSGAVTSPDSMPVEKPVPATSLNQVKKKERKQRTVAVLVITAVSATIFLLYNVRSQ